VSAISLLKLIANTVGSRSKLLFSNSYVRDK
jgi:hypothetical protein